MICMHGSIQFTSLNSPYCGPYNGPEHFWVRELSPAEERGRYSIEKLFGDQFNRFRTWPIFDSVKSSGKELRDGFATMWSTFIVTVGTYPDPMWTFSASVIHIGTSLQRSIFHKIVEEALLAAVALQPFHTAIALKDWQFQVYGVLWTAALLSVFTGLSVTTIFLAFLHAVPAELSYMWVSNIGAWIAAPIALLVLATLTSAIATSYSAWVSYGESVGIIFAIGVLFVVWFSTKAANCLAGACVATEALFNKRETTDDSVRLNTDV